jgi:hypothetical protein
VSRLVYLYGFTAGTGAHPPGDLIGVGGTPARPVDLGRAHAWVGDVPAAEFAPEAVEARMRDLVWVGDQGALHERVVTWFVDHGGILPVRLLTLYSSDEALRASVGSAEGVRAELDRLSGLREWDLKVSYRAETLRAALGQVSEAVAALEREGAAADPGRRYLLDRKREKLLDVETGRAANRLGDEVLAALRPHVREARRVASPRDQADLPVVLQAALLVDQAREQELQAAAGTEGERLRPHGVTVQLTGPWAPYRFIGSADGGSGHG